MCIRDSYNDGSANGSITVKKGEVAEIPVPEREGYDFAGWYSDIGCLVPFDVNAPVTQDVIKMCIRDRLCADIYESVEY